MVRLARGLLWSTLTWCAVAGVGCSARQHSQSEDLGTDVGTSDADLWVEPDVVGDVPVGVCEPPAGPGCACDEDGQCQSGHCVVLPDGGMCVATCPASGECGVGQRCGGVLDDAGGLLWVCLPSVGVQCVPCAENLDCGDVGCAGFGGGRACLVACDDGHPCFEGETCTDLGESGRRCVPDEGSCACSAMTKGTKRACSVINDVGTCMGVSECAGEAGWGECSAAPAVAESCNGVDDDCNGVVDDGELCPAALDECSRGACVEGECGEEARPEKEGKVCVLQSKCRKEGTCQAGTCVGVPVDCNDSNPCTDEECEEGKGCVYTPKTAVCDDGNVCTDGDQCIQGKCMPVALVPGCLGSCGDGNCGLLEKAADCPVDCGWCGDGVCGIAEWVTAMSSCPKDCEAACGDGECDGGENTGNCLVDCSGCGDGFCGLKETGSNCILDCPASCGNKVCEPTEGPAVCPYDCSPSCGDEVCEAPENWFHCPEDCTVCGDHVCGTGEAQSCPSDCQAQCGNALCEGGENPQQCPVDCGSCGDGVCGHWESHVKCPWDCAFGCGDAVCAPWLQEDEASCPADCGTPDGDGDGVGTGMDNCPWMQNSGQEDLDGDGKGDVCDGDIDGDGEANLTDCAPYDATRNHQAVEACDGIDWDCDGLADPNSLCDDGLTCTTDLCGGPVGCLVVAKHSACSDSLPCTFDSCVPGGVGPTGCLHQVVPDGAPCTDSGLVPDGMPSPDGRVCSGGACVCVPECGGKVCGPDGCGGVCGMCGAGLTCTGEGTCVCTPMCGGKQCGPDGCRGDCGACGQGAECNLGGSCVCKADHLPCSGLCCPPSSMCYQGACCYKACVGKECGPDGCGGSCGACGPGQECIWPGVCQCLPQCAGKQCGDDGCGGSCGSCGAGQACLAGKCSCTPSCVGVECGSDGCGGQCGVCAPGKVCSEGQCVAGTVEVCMDGWCGVTWGSFTMGSESSETCRSYDVPAHPVMLNSSFEIYATEFTVGDWNWILPIGPGGAADEPVRFVSWWDVLYACNALSTKEGLPACYTLNNCVGTPGTGCAVGAEMCEGEFQCESVNFEQGCLGYRLPTEAEWEYAARAGVSTATPFGDISGSCDCSADTKLNLSAWYCGNSSKVQAVGLKVPNGWGLHDVLGNVAEFVFDNNGYYGSGMQTDPVGATWSRGAVIRGGSFASQKSQTRFAYRGLQPKQMRTKSVGFRPVRTLMPVCMPQCAGKSCGPDGCGGVCGTCGGGQSCVNGTCVIPMAGTCESGFCFAPNGGFRMGAAAGDVCQAANEVPQHVVHLSRGFWVMQDEVTRQSWQEKVGEFSAWADGCGGSCPVSWVSFAEAAYYANVLSLQEGYEPCYAFSTDCQGLPGACVGSGSCVQPFTCTEVESLGPTCEGYRLPTEAEWEYMARAGTTTDLYNGNLTQCSGVASLLTPIAVHGGVAMPSAVGGRQPNVWGIRDVAGNIAEWVEDSLQDYSTGTQVDPLAIGFPRCPSTRGGSYKSQPSACRHAARLPFGICSTYLAADAGFRLVRTVFEMCIPDCFERSCGDDGCGGSCGPPCGASLGESIESMKEVAHART